ncbi:MAG: hypothetical protein GY807_20435 [Gammaproteobacteria bacterium]|nr:hypothetical protein [Gammaproteobacteria bacterium]
MAYFSNKEIREAPPQYEPARLLENGNVTGPRCCGQKMARDGGCGQGCCSDYKCPECGHTVRIEWPD